MKIIQFYLIFFLSLSIATNAQTKKAENTLLWEISGKDLNKPSYLFGTYHFADKGFVDTMKVVNEKLATAGVVVGELIMDKDVAMKLMPFMLLKNNSLEKILSSKAYNLVDNYLIGLGQARLKNFEKFSPMALQVFLIQLTAPKTFTETNPPIDQYFQDYGKANQKTVLGLETAEEQASILFGEPLERQAEKLVEFVKNEEKNKLEAEKLHRDYIAQDLNALAETYKNPEGYTQAEMDKLLKDRNVKWIEKLPRLMQNQSLFIAVGAAHLISKDGLISGLRAKGYTLTPLRTN